MAVHATFFGESKSAITSTKKSTFYCACFSALTVSDSNGVIHCAFACTLCLTATEWSQDDFLRCRCTSTRSRHFRDGAVERRAGHLELPTARVLRPYPLAWGDEWSAKGWTRKCSVKGRTVTQVQYEGMDTAVTQVQSLFTSNLNERTDFMWSDWSRPLQQCPRREWPYMQDAQQHYEYFTTAQHYSPCQSHSPRSDMHIRNWETKKTKTKNTCEVRHRGLQCDYWRSSFRFNGYIIYT